MTNLTPKELLKQIKKSRKIVVHHKIGPNTSIYHEVKKSIILEAFKSIVDNGGNPDLFKTSLNENNTLYIHGGFQNNGL